MTTTLLLMLLAYVFAKSKSDEAILRRLLDRGRDDNDKPSRDQKRLR